MRAILPPALAAEVWQAVDELRAQGIARGKAERITRDGRYQWQRIPARDAAYQVYPPNSDQFYTVDLASRFCTCRQYAENGDCGHLWWLDEVLSAFPVRGGRVEAPATAHTDKTGCRDDSRIEKSFAHPADDVEAHL